VKALAWVTAAAAGLAIMGCTGKYSVGGTVTGLRGQGLVLEDNSGNDLSVSSNGSFIFSKRLKNAITYSVTVKTQPSNPSQTCTVNNGSGTIDKANVTNVVVSCTQAGRFAYVANQLSNNLSAYSIDSATGNLTAVNGSPFAVSGTTPVSLAVDPNGQFLYVVDNGSNDVSVYAIDNTTGALAATGLPLPTGSSPEAVTVDPTDSFLYVANLASNSVSGYSINSSTGLLTELVNSPFAVGTEPSSVKIDPSGSFLYVTEFSVGKVAVFSIDPGTGSLSTVSGSPFGAGTGALSIAFNPAGSVVYVANETAATISEYSINASTGALTAVSGSPLSTGSSPESMAVDPAGRYSMLHARVVPPVPADTEYADLRAAYDTLPAEMKAQLEGLRAHHSVAYSRHLLGFEFSPEEQEKVKGAVHPLVRTIPRSHRRSLYLASHASRIVDWPIPEGRLLLRDLMEHATQPEFVYPHAWRVGDLVICDNRCTMHRARPFDDTKYRRELRRVTTLDIAEPALAAAGS